MKVLKCTDLGNASCMAVFKSEIVDNIVKQATEHAKMAHNLVATPEIIEKMKGHIKEETAPVAATAPAAAQPAQAAHQAPAAQQPAPAAHHTPAAAPAATPEAKPAQAAAPAAHHAPAAAQPEGKPVAEKKEPPKA